VLVWGEKDRFIPDGCRAFYLKRLKGVRYEPVPDCGHCPQIECPDRTAEILLKLPGIERGGRAARPAGGGRTRTPVPRRRGAVVTAARAPRA